MTKRLQKLPMAALVLMGVSVIYGVVWLSFAAAQWMALYWGKTLATAIVGAFFLLAPALVLVYRAWLQRPTAPVAPQPGTENNQQAEAIALVTSVAEKLAATSPILAVSVAAMVGFVSVKYPAALAPLMRAFTQPNPP